MVSIAVRPRASERATGRWVEHAVTAAGLIGASIVAACSWRLGATVQHLIRVHVHGRIVVHTIVHPGTQPRVRAAFSAGLGLLSLAFLLTGRAVLRELPTISWREVRLRAVLSSLPMLAAAPLLSRDVWAYAAQGLEYARGIDPYRFGPAHLTGEFGAQVDPRWRHTPAPYGPVFLAVARGAVALAHGHPYLAAGILKAVAWLGLMGIVACLPVLCRRLGGRTDLAMWLVAASPLTLVATLGGAHNDLLAAGVAAAALVVATAGGPLGRTFVPAAVLLAVAAEIKAPAAVLLAFLPHVWLRHAPRGPALAGRRGALAGLCALTAAVGLGTAGVVRAVTGLGFGWVRHLDAASTGAALLSVPNALVLIGNYLRGDRIRDLNAVPTHTAATLATVASVAAAVVVAALWWAGRTRPPLPLAALALLAGVVLSTTAQPWYFGWPLLAAVLVPALGARAAAVVAALGVALTVAIEPDGKSVFAVPVGTPLIVITVAACLGVLSGRRPRLGATPRG